MNAQFSARANFVLFLFGIVLLVYIVKVIPYVRFDPIIYDLKISGNKYLNANYLKNLVMPVGGVRFSKLVIPTDLFIKSAHFEYLGNHLAELIVQERKPVFISSTSSGYFLTSLDGVFLMPISKDELYKFTALPIFFGIDSFNFDKNGIINTVLLGEIKTIFSYPDWFRKMILEVDLKSTTIYFTKGVSIKFKDFNLDSETEKAILSIISASSIGARYVLIGNNFISLSSTF